MCGRLQRWPASPASMDMSTRLDIIASFDKQRRSTRTPDSWFKIRLTPKWSTTRQVQARGRLVAWGRCGDSDPRSNRRLRANRSLAGHELRRKSGRIGIARRRAQRALQSWAGHAAGTRVDRKSITVSTSWSIRTPRRDSSGPLSVCWEDDNMRASCEPSFLRDVDGGLGRKMDFWLMEWSRPDTASKRHPVVVYRAESGLAVHACVELSRVSEARPGALTRRGRASALVRLFATGGQ